MCGIAGFSLAPSDRGKFDTALLAKSLLLEIEVRGRDATGAAWYEGDTLIVQKDAMKAKDFVHFLDMPETTTNAILHTRFGTKGSEFNNNNNHPVITGNIVGVHNGGVWNDDSLFRIMDLEDERIAEVDTEAIFAAIAYGQEVHPKKAGPRLAGDLLGILGKIDGSAAIAWHEIEGDKDVLHVSRIYGSPLVWGQTKAGSFIFASTKYHLENACKETGIELDAVIDADEGVYMRVRAGRVEEYQTFDVWPKKKTYSTYGTTYSYGGGTTTVTKKNDGGTAKPGEKIATVTSIGKAASEHVATAATIRAAIESFNAELEAQGEFSPFLSHAVLSAHLGLVFGSDVLEAMDADDYSEQYTQREEAIDRFINELSDVDDDARMVTVMELRGFLRPGDWIVTDLGHLNGLLGQVYLLPQQFPYGTYTLRVLVPNSRYESGFEPIIVERRLDEFEVVDFGSQGGSENQEEEEDNETDETEGTAEDILDTILDDLANEDHDIN